MLITYKIHHETRLIALFPGPAQFFCDLQYHLSTLMMSLVEKQYQAFSTHPIPQEPKSWVEAWEGG